MAQKYKRLEVDLQTRPDEVSGLECNEESSTEEQFRELGKDIASKGIYQPQISNEDRVDIDDAIEMIPLGLFHYRLLVLCGMAYMADAIEISLLSFIVILITEEWSLSVVEAASISAAVFSGSMVGNVVLWGPLGDWWGRRKTFIAGSTLVCISGMLCTLAPNLHILLLCNFFVGVGVGSVFISPDILAELLPCEWRGLFLMNINYFWTLGNMFVAAMAWLVLDSVGWRVLIICCAVPSLLTVILSLVYLPESPRWLMLQGRTDEAQLLLNEINQINTKSTKHQNAYPYSTTIILNPLSDNESGHTTGGVSYTTLLSPKHKRTTIVLGLLSFSWGLTYYGVVMFLSSMFSEESTSSLEFLSNEVNITSQHAFDNADSNDENVDTTFEYADILTVASSEIIGSLWLHFCSFFFSYYFSA